jgi:hypothetical protein
MKKILLATALTLFAGTAFAENSVVLSFDTFEKNGITTKGLRYDLEGSIGNFAYKGYAFDGDVQTLDFKAVGLKANWTGLNLGPIAVGPALSYNHQSLVGASDDVVSAGLALKTSIGSVAIKSDALFSLDNSNTRIGTLSGQMPIGNKFSAKAEYSYVDVGNPFKSHQFAIGARYDMTKNTFIEALINAERSAGQTGTGAIIGLGLRF